MITSTDSQSPGMRDDRRGTVQRQARKALLRELAGLLVSFGAVAMALHLQGVGSAQFAYVTLVLAALAEILFLWRSVWAALALVAVSRTLPGRLHLILGTAVATWGTRSARRSVAGIATTTALAGTLFSGAALADTGTTTDTTEYLWSSSTTTAEYVHPLDTALSGGVPSRTAASDSSPSASTDSVFPGSGEFEAARETEVASQPPAQRLEPASDLQQMPPSTPSLTATPPPISDTLSSRLSTKPSTRDMSTPVLLPSSNGDSVDLSTAYTVAEGDCLWDIAATMLGENASDSEIDALWRDIYDANELVIGYDPNHIEPGMILETIPLPASSSK